MYSFRTYFLYVKMLTLETQIKYLLSNNLRKLWYRTEYTRNKQYLKL